MIVSFDKLYSEKDIESFIATDKCPVCDGKLNKVMTLGAKISGVTASKHVRMGCKISFASITRNTSHFYITFSDRFLRHKRATNAPIFFHLQDCFYNDFSILRLAGKNWLENPEGKRVALNEDGIIDFGRIEKLLVLM